MKTLEIRNVVVIGLLLSFACGGGISIAQSRREAAAPVNKIPAVQAESSGAYELNQAALKLAAAKQFDKAIENLERACELAPDDKTIKTNLVMV
ncbi:MAG TPA: hypothetical protein PKK26_17715, partial [Candidatus Wallbacteria bacterium]|nr:hypothetical protein [Candidatus Wallbacteria bacterium]